MSATKSDSIVGELSDFATLNQTYLAHQEQEHDFLQKMKDIEEELSDIKSIEDTKNMSQGQDDILKTKG